MACKQWQAAPCSDSPPARTSPACQIFVKTVEGAVFKRVVKGDPADTPWQIFQLQGDAFMPIGRQAERPTNENLEIAFANASAASSPLKNLNPFKK